MRTDFGYFEEKQLGKPYDVRMLKRLYPFTRPYKFLLACSIILIVLITLLDLSLPYVTKIAIDRYIVPRMEAAETPHPGTAGKKTRHLRADLSNPEIRAIVEKYPGRFDKHDAFALIDLDDLAQLDAQDLVVLRQRDLTGVAWVTAAFMAIIVLTFGVNMAQVLVMEYAGQMMMHDLRVRLFDHIQHLPVAFFNSNPVGRLVTRVTNDIQNMNELFTSVIAFVFKDLFLLLGITVVLVSINWQLALISFMVLPVVLAASVYFSGQAREAFRILRIKLAEINTRFSETIGGIKVLQVFLQEKGNLERFTRLNHEHYLAGMRQVHVFAVFMPVIELLGAVALAVVIYYGGARVLADSVSLGALVAFISYMKMFFRPIRDIAEKYNILQNAMASAERIFLILDTEAAPRPPDAPLATSILGKIAHLSLEGVSFAYVAGEPVLKQVSLEVRAGETIAVVGPTGSGKTTLINLIVRFYDPTSGRISINGRDIRAYGADALRSRTALVTQEPFLFSESIRENIFQGRNDVSGPALENILTASNCKTLVERLPEGVETVLTEGGGSISSGERQLISIARAFARNPDLIILDEATSYIDSETEQKIQEALENLMANRTSIVVAHRLSTARQANRIFVLNRGRIIESGSHDELMSRQGFYFKLNQLQH